MKGKVPPRNQLQMLRRLARFSEREKIKLTAVLTGNPLHKAPRGKKFENITVLYSKSPEAHAKYLVKVVCSKGDGAVLISGSAAAEKIALGRGVTTMRVSTFRKAFDIGGSDYDGNERGGTDRKSRGGNERSSTRGRPSRRRPQKQDAEKTEERPPKDMSDADAINELIDLVD
jgi:hypothetical protein